MMFGLDVLTMNGGRWLVIWSMMIRNPNDVLRMMLDDYSRCWRLVSAGGVGNGS